MTAVAVRTKPKSTTPVLQTPAHDCPFGHASGRHIVIDHKGILSPHALKGDLADIDFDCRSYQGEGLYLLRRHFSGRPKGWDTFTGPHRLASMPTLHIQEEAEEGGWRWRPWTDDERANTAILGRVHDIYRRAGTPNRPGTQVVGRLASLGGEHGNGRAVVAVGEDGQIEVTGLRSFQLEMLKKLLLEPVILELSPGPGARLRPW